MKLSESTIVILKNFSSINQSIFIKKGSKLRTMSVMRNILAEANVSEIFPKDFAIYDLNQFLNGLGLHQGKYEALKQFGKVKVYRDANRDMNYDETKIQEGIFGINIHKAGADSTFVENWSEGCQVFKRAADFEEFMTIARKAASVGNKSFTYTLINSKDIA
jgi:hypothetical protein